MNSLRSVIMIVPRLPPTVDGVGDYALNLARQLRKDFGIQTHFIVGDPQWKGEKNIENFLVSQVEESSSDALFSVLDNIKQNYNSLLVHYVGYGYAKRGCPIWLINSLQQWRQKNPQNLLVTMFHEIYAFGMPWTSSFWLSPLQRMLASCLAKMSDRCVTNTEAYADSLYRLGHDKHKEIPVLPVFSNIGEPSKIPQLAERNRRLVIFGQPHSKIQVYKTSFTELSNICNLLGIEEIFDIGPSDDLTLSSVDSVPIVYLGKCSPQEINKILLNSRAGFLNYPVNLLGKSTIFAAYCSHGVLTISPRGQTKAVDGIQGGIHYWTPDSKPASLKNIESQQEIATNAHIWYHQHNLLTQAKIFAMHLDLK